MATILLFMSNFDGSVCVRCIDLAMDIYNGQLQLWVLRMFDLPALDYCCFRIQQSQACEQVDGLVSRSVPVLDERESRRAPEVHLTALCTWATVPRVESVACVFARGVAYSSRRGMSEFETSAVQSTISKNGNYFEVTVMNPGEKTTIGVGLADADIFPTTKQMPGWVDHSYGYHGDDGRKFGAGKTESIWPTWVDGDVIGCGFDFSRGAIWQVVMLFLALATLSLA